MAEKDIIKFRVILKQEDPSTDIKNTKGVLIFQKNKIIFNPNNLDPNLKRTYSIDDLTKAILITIRERLKKKQVVLLTFMKNNVTVSVYFEPIDISSEFLLREILKFKEYMTKGSFSGVVGSLIEKIGSEGQKIVREFGAMIQSSSQDISHAIDQTRQFIRESTKTANILESDETNTGIKNKTINLEVSDIDEILKRSLASEKIEAMISGLIAKGLISAKDQKFQEALDALKIAREAAQNENMKEYTEIADDSIKEIETAENVENLDRESLDRRAIKYANEARNIVADWEASKNNEEKDKSM
ncbi:MAG: hypothetical protein ACFE98_06380 [Candidatus Hermodarchaeota archaeon]